MALKATPLFSNMSDEAALLVYGEGRSTIWGEYDAYAKVPLIYRAINLRCDSLSRVPVYVYGEGDKIISKTDSGDGFAFENTDLTAIYKCSIHNLLWLNEAAFLLSGAGYTLKLKNRYRYGKGLQWLNPRYMFTQYKGGELLFYQQLPNGGGRFPKDGYWTVDDLLYFRAFNPFDDIEPGVSATSVALNDARTLGAVTEYLSNHFINDAVDTTLVSAPKGMQEGQRNQLITTLKNVFRKLGKRSSERFVAVGAEIKLERFTSELKDSALDIVDTHAMRGIADAFGMPTSLLRSDSGANRAISDNDRESFLNDTIIPRTKYYESIINPFLEEVGQRIEFAPQEMPELQVDETERAGSLKELVDAGVDLLVAMRTLGYDLEEEDWAILEKAQEEKKQKAEAIQIQTQQQPDQTPQQDQQPPQDMPAKADLEKWQRKSVNALKAGKGAGVDFESDKIPPELKASILKKLSEVRTEEDIRLIFSNGRH